ncbi:iron uptake porin [Synechococcus sp. UW140]|uniref:iron uptake porin n=1 Tax=Synechococcus sp. UW140 TaxID=368503 RepID=UPI000E0F0878|nr:iron uptake porin [Synechococcus sp. UW140]
MKLFQQLLVAPAALGLLAPVAANASDLNINGVSDYAASGEQVTSITQFSDVVPTDWAYQALSNLIERYGCVAGYPNGTYRGNRAMTRFEAAALLNACLDRITEVTDELKRLMKEFERELAILKGRVDGLEARVGELEATQFSTTTKLKGTTTFVIGANSFGGDAYEREQFGRNLFLGDKFNYINDEEYEVTGINGDTKYVPNPFYYEGSKSRYKGPKMADEANQYLGALTFNYDQRLDLLTSFTGKDLLKVRLRAGNFQNSAFGFSASTGINSFLGGQYSTMSGMETAFEEGTVTNAVKINRLFYQFPLGSNFTVTAGGVVRQDDMLAVWPSAYPAATVLDFFTYAGAPGTYNLNLGSGAGISWENDGFSISANYVSGNGNVSKVNDGYNEDYSLYNNGTDTYAIFSKNRSCEGSGGMMTDCASGTGTVQIAYTDDQWGIAAAYNYSSENAGNMNPGTATPLATQIGQLGNTNSVGLSAYWSPEDSGWMPSISAGWGLNSTSGGDASSYRVQTNGGSWSKSNKFTNLFGYDLNSATTQSWSLGLQWTDVFLKGNSAGMAVGQKGFVTALDLSGNKYDLGYGKSAKAEERLVRDGQYAWEWWYMFQVTDNISVTPALFYMSRPLGSATQGVQFNQFGGLLKTTFKF